MVRLVNHTKALADLGSQNRCWQKGQARSKGLPMPHSQYPWLRHKRRDLDDVQLVGARAWIALPGGPPANAAPSAHISNLSDLTRDINES